MKNTQTKINISLNLIVKSSLFVLVGMLLAKILSYTYKVIIARYFGPEIYGLFSLTIIISLWFTIFFCFGLYDGILRFISFYRGKKDKDKIRYIFKLSSFILFFSGIFGGIILYFLSEFISLSIFHDPNLIIFLKIISLAIPFYTLSFGLLSVIQAFEKIKVHTFISDFLRNFIQLILLLFFILIGIKTNSIIFSFFLGIVSLFLFSYFYCRWKLPSIFKKFRLKKDKKEKIKRALIFYSLPLIFSRILYSIFSYIDSFVIGYFRTISEVGFYNVAFPIATLIVIFPSLFMRIFPPLITKEFSRKNLSIVKRLSKQTEKWIFMIILPLSLLMIIFPGTFIGILFGSQYLAAEDSLRFLAVAFLFFSMSMVLENLILMIGKSKLILINMFLASLLNLFLNIILVPKYGINGAAFSTMFIYITLNIVLLFQVKYHTSIIPLKKDMFKILLSITPPTILLICIKRFIPTNLGIIILQVIFFMLFYLFLIFITKSLDKNDVMILKTIKEKTNLILTKFKE